MSIESPVIPSGMWPLKVCKYKKTRSQWKHVSEHNQDEEPTSTLRLVTWNISYDSQWPIERLQRALKHLEVEVFKCRPGEKPEPCCILLQEVHERVVSVLLKNEWVRKNFIVTPIHTRKWPDPTRHPYGNITLIEKSVSVTDAQIVHYGSSAMGRTAVVTDVRLRNSAGREKVLRIINTHLESLPVGAKARKHQLFLCSDLLKKEEVSGGVIAGDMNAVCDSDRDVHAAYGLRDAWWRKSAGDAESGYTWGYQGGGGDQHPKARLDKILFLPQKGFRLEEPERIGVGVQTERIWVSDHYGLCSRIHLL